MEDDHEKHGERRRIPGEARAASRRVDARQFSRAPTYAPREVADDSPRRDAKGAPGSAEVLSRRPMPSLDGQVKKLAGEIRDYARSQRELWRQVPWLALEADGRTGFGEGIVYRRGYLPVLTVGYTKLYVDCESGELVRWSENRMPPAEDADVLLLLKGMEELDASGLIDALEAEAAEPYFYGYDPAKQEIGRASCRERV